MYTSEFYGLSGSEEELDEAEEMAMIKVQQLMQRKFLTKSGKSLDKVKGSRAAILRQRSGRRLSVYDADTRGVAAAVELAKQEAMAEGPRVIAPFYSKRR